MGTSSWTPFADKIWCSIFASKLLLMLLWFVDSHIVKLSSHMFNCSSSRGSQGTNPAGFAFPRPQHPTACECGNTTPIDLVPSLLQKVTLTILSQEAVWDWLFNVKVRDITTRRRLTKKCYVIESVFTRKANVIISFLSTRNDILMVGDCYFLGICVINCSCSNWLHVQSNIEQLFETCYKLLVLAHCEIPLPNERGRRHGDLYH